MKLFNAIILLLASLIVPLSSHADAVAGFDSTSASLNQTVTLTVRSSSMSRSLEPDLSEILQHFEEINRQTSTRIQSINGRTASVSEWYIQLLPRATGEFRFQGIRVGNDSTGPLTIKVTKDPNTSTNPGADYFVTAAVDNPTPYVQQMVLLTVEIATKVTLRNWNPPELDIEGVRIQPLQYYQAEKEHLGHQYIVHQLRYALFPQRSGSLTIPAIRYSATLSQPSRRSLAVMSRPGRRIIMNSEPFDIEVKPKPSNAGTSWLPSANVAISLHHRNQPPFNPGDELVFNIDLMASDVLPEQIPSLTIPSIDGLSIYPEPEKRSLVETKTGLLSRLEQTIRVVPNGGGEFALPSFNVDWYSTVTNTPNTSTTAAYHFSVVGEPFIPDPAISNHELATSETIEDPVTPPLTDLTIDNGDSNIKVRSFTQYLYLLGLGALLTLALAIIYRLVRKVRNTVWFSNNHFYCRISSWAQSQTSLGLSNPKISTEDQALLHALSLRHLELSLFERKALFERLSKALIEKSDFAVSELNLCKSGN